MLFHWLDRLGNWNPQLWREVKQRVGCRSFLATTSVSLLGQWFLARELVSKAESLRNKSANLDLIARSDLTWRSVTFELLIALTLISLGLLFGLGSYLLARNLVREIRRETLMFLRLSGYPAGEILLGKILGVPILLHWAIAMALPLQLWAATQAGVLLGTIVTDGFAIFLSAMVYVFTIQTVMEWRSGHDRG